MTHPRRVLANLFLAFSISAVVVFGQSPTGGVNGTVSDTTGGVIPDVTLTLTNQGTGIVATAATNASGVYAFVSVAPGPYTLKAEKSGFKTAYLSAFQVNVNQTVTQDITLSVGEVTQTVEVRAEAPLLQASTSELGTVIGQQAVERLPLNGRNFTQLLLLTPGVAPVNTAQEWGSTVALPGSTWVKPAVNGQWNRSNMYLMDGVINNEQETSGYNVLPSLDAIQEFKVQSHNDKAEYGMVMGGTVNLVTRSGTNTLHGSGFEFLRNEVFNARDPFTDIVPVDEQHPEKGLKGPAPFRQNQFGATLGGPVYVPRLYDGRDKTFFFFSYDGWRYRLARKALYRVPTAEELSGDFSGWEQIIYDPTTTRPDPNNPDLLIRDPFPGNRIPPNLVSPMMVDTMRAFFDTPNIALGYDNVINNRPSQNDANGFQIRIDHQIGSKTTLFGRYNYLRVRNLEPESLKNGGTGVHRPQQVALGWNQMFTPTLMLNTRSAFTTAPWVQSPEHPHTVDQLSQLGWLMAPRFGEVVLDIEGMGPTGIGGDNRSLVKEHQFQLSQDVSWVKGNHQLKFGWLMFRQFWGGSNPYQEVYFGPDQTADPQQTGGVLSGIGLASALLGLPQELFGLHEQFGQRYYTWSFYGQDEWKVTPKFTLNFSLRYDFANPTKYSLPTPGTFDMNSGDYLIGGGVMPPPCSTTEAAPCIPGDGTLASIPGGDHIRLSERPDIRYPHRKNFGPRLGMAWQFAPRTVVRGGLSLVYDVFSGIGQENNNIQGKWPNSNYVFGEYNLLGEPLTSIDAAASAKISPLPDPDPWYGTDVSFDPRKRPPYSVQYNVEFQHQFTENLTGSLAYVGSVNRRLDFGYAINAAPTPGPGTRDEVDQRRPFPYMPYSPYYDSDFGRSSYNALQLELRRRFADGSMLLVAYTWSKTLDNGNSGWFGSENGPSGSSSVQNTYDFKSNRSVASYDVPHNFWVSGTWEPPVGKGKRWLQSGPLSWVVGNWRTDFIQSIRSGQPWNPMIPGDLANVGRGDEYLRPNLIGDPNPPQRSAQMWVNPAAFGIPQFAYGNVGRNSFRSNAVFSTDFALVKEFHMGERTILQFRAESFNIFNIMNYGVPNAEVAQSNFGTITGLADMHYPRQFQFGLKLTF